MVRQYPDTDGTVDRWVRRFLRAGQRTDTGMLLMNPHVRVKGNLLIRASLRARDATASSYPQTRPGQLPRLALLMIEALRTLGVAARFVSVVPIRAEPRTGRAIVAVGSTHAWCHGSICPAPDGLS